jgi:hypothetical protein
MVLLAGVGIGISSLDAMFNVYNSFLWELWWVGGLIKDVLGVENSLLQV